MPEICERWCARPWDYLCPSDKAARDLCRYDCMNGWAEFMGSPRDRRGWAALEHGRDAVEAYGLWVSVSPGPSGTGLAIHSRWGSNPSVGEIRCRSGRSVGWW